MGRGTRWFSTSEVASQTAHGHASRPTLPWSHDLSHTILASQWRFSPLLLWTWLAIGACGGDPTQPGNNRPVASAGDNQVVDVSATVTVSATGSSDADGDALDFSWALTSPGGSAASLSGTSGPTASFIADVFGEYRVGLTVSDGTATATDVVEVNSCYSQAHVVVLGSSTAAGIGASVPDRAWVDRYRASVQARDPSSEVTNLAVGGFRTYHIMPTGFVPPTGRPSPDPAHNVTQALALAPDLLIINLPSNDAAFGYPVPEQLANYDIILAEAATQSVPAWVSTTQPRNFSAGGRANLMEMRDSTFTRFGDYAVDLWSTLALSDGMIAPLYDSGDGIHLNDSGHQVLLERVTAKGIFCETV